MSSDRPSEGFLVDALVCIGCRLAVLSLGGETTFICFCHSPGLRRTESGRSGCCGVRGNLKLGRGSYLADNFCASSQSILQGWPTNIGKLFQLVWALALS